MGVPPPRVLIIVGAADTWAHSGPYFSFGNLIVGVLKISFRFSICLNRHEFRVNLFTFLQGDSRVSKPDLNIMP